MPPSRSRETRRRSERAPGILRGGVRPPDSERQVVEHGVRDQFQMNWRFVSGLLVIGLSGLLFVFFATDLFYVRTISVGGAHYLNESEIFRYAEIAEMHIFWIDPEEVRQRLIESSEVIADAQVVVGWPPNMVKILVEEREPQVIWIQSGVVALVDLHGNVLRYTIEGEELPDLVHVISEGMLEGPPGADSPIPAAAVSGALQLRQLGFQGDLHYHPVNGLGFQESGGWDVWLGVGTDMPNKLNIYEELRDNLLARGITPVEINVVNPEGAYYCGNVEGCL